jgi:hypothetical protein
MIIYHFKRRFTRLSKTKEKARLKGPHEVEMNKQGQRTTYFTAIQLEKAV